MTAHKRTSLHSRIAASTTRILGDGGIRLPFILRSRLRRLAGLFTAGGAILLLTLVAISQLILILNPYQRAGERVKFLLETQPAFESHLDATGITANAVKNQLALHSAAAITRSTGAAVDEGIISALTDLGISRSDVLEFTGLAKSLGNEIISLSAVLQREAHDAKLAHFFSGARQTSKVDSSIMIDMYHEIPAAIEQIDDLRERLAAIANGVRVIKENPSFQPILNVLDEIVISPDPLTKPILLNYAVALHTWIELPAICESLEIQFAGEAVMLNEIYSAVSQAYIPAQRWGYEQAEPLAKWVNREILLVTGGSALLIFLSTLILFWNGRLVLRLPHPIRLIQAVKLASPTSRTFNPRRSKSRSRYLQGARVLVNRLKEAQAVNIPAVPPTIKRPALRIVRAGVAKAVKALTRDHTFRVGSDPSNPVHITSSENSFIEIWIRPAKVGFFIEVMYSDAPVLLNNKPVTGARKLVNGDSIQILDFNLIFQE